MYPFHAIWKFEIKKWLECSINISCVQICFTYYCVGPMIFAFRVENSYFIVRPCADLLRYKKHYVILHEIVGNSFLMPWSRKIIFRFLYVSLGRTISILAFPTVTVYPVYLRTENSTSQKIGPFFNLWTLNMLHFFQCCSGCSYEDPFLKNTYV